MRSLEMLELARVYVAKILRNGAIRPDSVQIIPGTVYVDGYTPPRTTHSVFVVTHQLAEVSQERPGTDMVRYSIIGGPVFSRFGGVLVSESGSSAIGAYYLSGYTPAFDAKLVFPMTSWTHANGDSLDPFHACRMARLHLNRVVDSYPILPTPPEPVILACLARLECLMFADHLGRDGQRCAYSGTVAGRSFLRDAACPRCGTTEKRKAAVPDGLTLPESADLANDAVRLASVLTW